jgi:hypothetical protein
MVHFSTTFLVFAALVTTGFAVPAKRDASQVESDISGIGNALRKLNTVIASVTVNGTIEAAGSLRSAWKLLLSGLLTI